LKSTKKFGERRNKTSIFIDKLKHNIEKEVSSKLKFYAPELSDFLQMPQLNPSVSKTDILVGKVIKWQLLKDFKNHEFQKSLGYKLSFEATQNLQIITLSFINLISLLPFLSVFEFSDSYNSDHLFEENSSDEITSTKDYKSLPSDQIMDFPFPVFRYNKQNRNTAEGAAFKHRRFEVRAQESVENFLPYYLLINSFEI
jgi:hypothetical protein